MNLGSVEYAVESYHTNVYFQYYNPLTGGEDTVIDPYYVIFAEHGPFKCHVPFQMKRPRAWSLRFYGYYFDIIKEIIHLSVGSELKIVRFSSHKMIGAEHFIKVYKQYAFKKSKLVFPNDKIKPKVKSIILGEKLDEIDKVIENAKDVAHLISPIKINNLWHYNLNSSIITMKQLKIALTIRDMIKVEYMKKQKGKQCQSDMEM